MNQSNTQTVVGAAAAAPGRAAAAPTANQQNQRQREDFSTSGLSAQIGEFLAVLGLGRGLIEVKCVGPAGSVRMFWYESPAALLRDLGRLDALNDAGFSIYFGVATYSNRKGTKDLAAWLFTVHADLDGKDFVDNEADWRTGKVIARGLLDALPAALQPSALVDSGHGYHAYWVLSQPLEANGETIGQVEAVNAGLAIYLDSDPVVKDASRVLRLPGFQNVKYPADPLQVTLEYCTDRRFALGDFAAICAPPKVIQPPAARNGTDPRPGDDYNARGDWSELLTHYGWTEVGRRGEASYWRRPGKENGVSARLNRGGDGLLRVFSSNAMPLEARSYSLFGAYGALDHNGDYTAAAVALAALGYGAPKATKATTTTSDDQPDAASPDLPDHYTHGAVGRMFARKFAGQVLFNTTSERWMIYDEMRWIEDAERALRRMAKSIVFDLYALVNTIENDDLRKALAAFARRCDSPSGTEAILSEAANLMPVRAETFDQDPRYFNVMNGTLDLETGSLLPHDPEHRISQLSPVVYDPDADCPVYDRAILEIFAGDDDTVRFFEEAVGATLSGRATKNMVSMHGESGDNGKTTVSNLLLEMFGDYGAKGDSSLLVRGDRYDPSRAQPTVVALKGKRFCVVQEIPQGRTMDETLVKDLTGGDPITARRLHENTMTFWPSHMIWVYGNYRLKIEDTTIFNRLYEIPFTVEFAKGDPRRDDDLPAKLSAELSGIFNRFLAGYQRFVSRNRQLSPSRQVVTATASYRQESDSVARFIGERFQIMRDRHGNPDGQHSEGATELFNYYKAYCTVEDLTAANQTQFGKALTRMGIPAKTGHPVVRLGLRKLTEAEREARMAGLDGEEIPAF